MEPTAATPDVTSLSAGANAPGSPPSEAQLQELDKIQELENKIIGVFKSVYDPEVPANIYELGLIYAVDVQADGAVTVQMTLTTPACPTAASLVGEVQRKVAALPGVTSAKVDLVWSPPWTPDRMTEAARVQLGLFD
jgi:FeS assembly SUF system protein